MRGVRMEGVDERERAKQRRAIERQEKEKDKDER